MRTIPLGKTGLAVPAVALGCMRLTALDERGAQTYVMGPVGGGRLGAPSKVIQDLLPGKVQSSAEMALRFVMNNRNVNIALSGMSSMDMVEENAAVDRDGSVLDYCRLNDITIQPWSPFQYGFFGGVFLGSEKYPELNAAIDKLAEKYLSLIHI